MQGWAFELRLSGSQPIRVFVTNGVSAARLVALTSGTHTQQEIL